MIDDEKRVEDENERWSDFHLEGWMNSNDDHGRGNVFAKVEKVDDRADDHTRSIGACVYAELRIASTKERKRIERETKRWSRERERERSKEAKWEGKKFVTAKRNGGPRKNSERRAEREGDRIDFHCRLKIQWAARERVRAADSRIENRIRGGEGGGKTDGRTWKISFVRAGVQTSACKSAGHCQEDCQFESNRID